MTMRTSNTRYSATWANPRRIDRVTLAAWRVPGRAGGLFLE
jgi:hypothetical protein